MYVIRDGPHSNRDDEHVVYFLPRRPTAGLIRAGARPTILNLILRRSQALRDTNGDPPDAYPPPPGYVVGPPVHYGPGPYYGYGPYYGAYYGPSRGWRRRW
jgi:hypothetical protein